MKANLKLANDLIAKAKKEIERCGWMVVEELQNHSGEIHLELTKNGQRKGWGMFDRVYCWTEAFESVTGKRWVTLLNS